jgi:hypothetical protein
MLDFGASVSVWSKQAKWAAEKRGPTLAMECFSAVFRETEEEGKVYRRILLPSLNWLEDTELSSAATLFGLTLPAAAVMAKSLALMELQLLSLLAVIGKKKKKKKNPA